MRSIATFFLLAVCNFALAQIHEVKAPHFAEVTIFGPFKVNLVKAAASKVEIDYRGIDPSDVTIKCSGDELEIRLRTNGLFDFRDNDRNGNRKYAAVTVYYTSIEVLEAKGGASVRATEPIVASRFKLTSRMGADVKLALKVKELDLDSSMGSEVDLTGTAEVADIKAKMGTDIDASQLQCQEVTVSASMGADVKVFAEKELNASANFGASVSCKGNPPRKHTSGSFGADVN